MPFDLLDGIKVIELSMYAFAPSCAAVLADWGADVVKIVPPTKADPMMNRKVIAGLPDKDVGLSFMWEQLNRGKRCIGLDVSSEEGQAVLAELVRQADVFVTNLLPDARRRFGVDADEIRSINPRLIYARASGHGDRGPEREEGGYDHTDFWARTGMAHAASMVSDEFVPQPGPAMGDVTSGAFLAGAIAAALFRRERTGAGGVVDVSLLSSGTWAFAPGMIASQLYDVDAIPRKRHAEQPNPLVGCFMTRDRRQIYLAGIRTDTGFGELAEAVGLPGLAQDPRFASDGARLENASACIAELDKAFACRDLSEWQQILRDVETPWSIVQTAREAATDPQTVANGYVMDVDNGTRNYPLVASPAQFDGQLPTATRAPEHGEHTELVLLEAGFDWGRIQALQSNGVIN
jgi:crotonobetainyl-CoA:carnitine CoA-transferase CaiB-like acyl-CoA transferase